MRILTRPPDSTEKSMFSILLLSKLSSSAANALLSRPVATISINVNIFVIIVFILIPIIYSCRLILELRSTQSPVRSSWIISLISIALSLI